MRKCCRGRSRLIAPSSLPGLDFATARHLAPLLAGRKGLRPFPFGAPGCAAGLVVAPQAKPSPSGGEEAKMKTNAPTKRQLSYLRRLASDRGQSFTYPHTAAEASREIERLLAGKPDSYTVRRIEREQISREMATRGDAASVREFETTGYGSSARWVGGEER